MEQTFIEVVGVLGDVHAQDVTLSIALNFLKEYPRIDKILCTGDILSGDGSAERCCELLEQAGVLSVRGNHERWHFEGEPFEAEVMALAEPEDLAAWPARLSQSARAYLMSLPPSRTFRTPYGELLLCHGLGNDDMAGVFPGESRVVVKERLNVYGVDQAKYPFVVNGHTHQRMVRQIESVTIINAGTLLLQPEASCAIIDFRAAQVEFFCINTVGAVKQSQTYRLRTEQFIDNLA